MTEYDVDARALVQRSTDEAGSTWIRQMTDPQVQPTVLLAEITLAEVAAALAAKHRAPGGITQEQRDRILSRFLQDCDEHVFCSRLIVRSLTVLSNAPNATACAGLMLSHWPQRSERARSSSPNTFLRPSSSLLTTTS